MTETVVIKLGGNATEQLTPQFFDQLARWRAAGVRVLMIHGGGPQINAWSERLGLTVHKRGGIRVTDADTLAVTQAVLLGVVQPALCLTLHQHGLPVMGLNTTDNALLTGTLLDQQLYGAVGKITQVNTTVLNRVLADYVGVLAPLAQTSDGTMLNVNADMAAVAVARALGATRLMLVTDVPGVIVNGTTAATIDPQQASRWVQQRIITSGMEAKINAAIDCVHAGTQVNITNDVTRPGTMVLSAAM